MVANIAAQTGSLFLRCPLPTSFVVVAQKCYFSHSFWPLCSCFHSVLSVCEYILQLVQIHFARHSRAQQQHPEQLRQTSNGTTRDAAGLAHNIQAPTDRRRCTRCAQSVRLLTCSDLAAILPSLRYRRDKLNMSRRQFVGEHACRGRAVRPQQV